MTTREVLEGARDRIRSPEDWCDQGLFRGRSVCALGALKVVLQGCEIVDQSAENGYVGFGRVLESPAGRLLERLVDAPTVDLFNDTHTHAEVLELFNLAIADEIAKEEAHTRHMVEEAEREAVEDPAVPLVFA